MTFFGNIYWYNCYREETIPSQDSDQKVLEVSLDFYQSCNKNHLIKASLIVQVHQQIERRFNLDHMTEMK